MLEIYGHEKSRAFRVLWALEEIGLKYRHIRLNFDENEHRSEKFLSINPSGKVPVLIDGDQVIHESSAILLHLHDNYAQKTPLFVEGPVARTSLFQWLFFGSSELEQGLWTSARHTFILPESERIPAAIAWGQQEFLTQLSYLSKMLGSKDWLLADKFTIADIQIAQILLWATQQQKLDLRYDNIRTYLNRATSRTAFRTLVKTLKKGDR